MVSFPNSLQALEDVSRYNEAWNKEPELSLEIHLKVSCSPFFTKHYKSKIDLEKGKQQLNALDTSWILSSNSCSKFGTSQVRIMPRTAAVLPTVSLVSNKILSKMQKKKIRKTCNHCFLPLPRYTRIISLHRLNLWTF